MAIRLCRGVTQRSKSRSRNDPHRASLPPTPTQAHREVNYRYKEGGTGDTCRQLSRWREMTNDPLSSLQGAQSHCVDDTALPDKSTRKGEDELYLTKI